LEKDNRVEKRPVTVSTFGDEIAAKLSDQLIVLESHGIWHLELRSIEGRNVLDLTESQIREARKELRDRGFRLSAIGSPLGKVRLEESFPPELERLRRAIDLAHFFETPNIRIFSFSEKENPDRYASEVFRRLEKEASLAQSRGVRLLHENEARIFGESPERCLKIFEKVPTPALRAVFDPANFVVSGYKSKEAWDMLKEHVVHFHIKDARSETKEIVPAGKGDGQVQEILREAWEGGFDGFLTLEPHLVVAGESSGFTGPGRFSEAVDALKEILEKIGAKHR